MLGMSVVLDFSLDLIEPLNSKSFSAVNAGTTETSYS
jgi:hypothetical protein